MLKIKDISIDDLYWFIKLGKPKYKVTANELVYNINKYIKQPVFFLSTGRCGTKWFSELLLSDKNNAVFHSPKPALDRQSKIAYELIIKDNFSLNNNCNNLLKEAFFSSREQHLRYTYKTGKRYIETNNYVTFFAPILYEIFPDAKFVHITRNPFEFIKSGINRNYYTGRSEDNKRIEANNEYWNNYSQAEKIAWLWKETNFFIEEFKNKYNPNIYYFNFNELTLENVKKLLLFIESDIQETTIKKLIPKKLNKQNSIKNNLDKIIENEKNNIDNILGEYLNKYNY